MNKIKKNLLIIILLFAILVPYTALAQKSTPTPKPAPATPTSASATPKPKPASTSKLIFTTPPELQNFLKAQDLKSFIKSIPELLTMFGYLMFFVSILVAGILYLASFGNEEQAVRAKTALTAAAIGIVIVLFAKTFVEYIISHIWPG